MKKVLLVMRKGWTIHGDHIDTLWRLGIELHLMTEIVLERPDPRFASVTIIPKTSREAAVANGVEVCTRFDICFALTFQETDIEICSRICEIIGARTTPIVAADTARDKSSQRDFLALHGLPSPGSRKVSSIAEAEASAEQLGYPVIVKPTRAASSMQVSLVHSPAELVARLRAIEDLVLSKHGNYYEVNTGVFALIEEFLPGNEVTLDGVVVDGRFILGGIHNKMRMPGPFFEEDLYSLPFRHPRVESSLGDIAARICEKLELVNSLFNVELRQNAEGEYKVVEFSPRISGGHVYRNIRDVYGIDLVATHAASCLPSLASMLPLFSARTEPRLTTCIKFIYRTGEVIQNRAGTLAQSSHFAAYYPLALPGSVVKCAPHGFNITGLLSMRGPFRSEIDIDAIEAEASAAQDQLDLVIAGIRQ